MYVRFDGPGRLTERRRDLLIAQPLHVAQHHRRAVPLRQRRHDGRQLSLVGVAFGDSVGSLGRVIWHVDRGAIRSSEVTSGTSFTRRPRARLRATLTAIWKSQGRSFEGQHALALVAGERSVRPHQRVLRDLLGVARAAVSRSANA